MFKQLLVFMSLLFISSSALPMTKSDFNRALTKVLAHREPGSPAKLMYYTGRNLTRSAYENKITQRA